MIRIPGSFNSKCILEGKDPEVRIIQRWDGNTPKINLLLGSFYAHLVDQTIKESQRQKEIERYRKKYVTNVNDIKWIEILLETPISDYRKNAISLILAPYLINIKKLPYSNAFNIIKDWLNRCDSLRRLDSNFNYRIKSALENAIQKGIPPMSLAKLREKNRELHDILTIKMNN
jgi:hypothetical protein